MSSPSPRWTRWTKALIAAGVSVAVATAVGAAFAPWLLVHHPFWLLALNPWPRHQLLVAPNADILPFVSIVVARGLVSCAVALELGRHYGTRGVALIEGRSAESGQMVRTIERLFGRFSTAFLLFTPGWFTSALAGMSGVTRTRSLTLNSVGLAGWAVVHYRVGEWLEPWTAPIMQYLREHMLAATLVCVALVALYQGHVWRKRSLSVLQKRRGDETPP